MRAFLKLLACDVRLQRRHGAQWAALILFFVIVILLLPFAIGPDPDLLRRLAPGLIWLAAVLMSLLALDGLFIQDARDGTLDAMMLSSLALPMIVCSRLAVQSLSLLGVMLVMLVPAAFLLGIDVAMLPVLALTFILGIPTLTLIGGVMGAITAGLRRNPALLTLLLIPFYIPVLIFAVTACDAAAIGASMTPHLCLLGALLAVLAPSTPFIVAQILRQNQG